jgi:hypothetical protein
VFFALLTRCYLYEVVFMFTRSRIVFFFIIYVSRLCGILHQLSIISTVILVHVNFVYFFKIFYEFKKNIIVIPTGLPSKIIKLYYIGLLCKAVYTGTVFKKKKKLNSYFIILWYVPLYICTYRLLFTIKTGVSIMVELDNLYRNLIFLSFFAKFLYSITLQIHIKKIVILTLLLYLVSS